MATSALPIPGFVDLQVNGYRGVDFSSPELTPESCADTCRELLSSGTAAFLPTVITSSVDIYRRNLPIIADVMDDEEFAGRVLGVHLEGPFISSRPGAVGAHDPQHVQKPDPGLLDDMLEWAHGYVRLLTVAADIDGVEELIEHARARAVAVSVGHSLYTGVDLSRVAEFGAKALTHLGNGLPNSLPRHPNPLWAALAQDALDAMIITDGHHLPPEFIATVIKAKTAAHTIVVSDASPLAGMPPGEYETLGNQVVLEEDGLLHNPEKDCLVGSSATMLQCMNVLAGLALVTLDDMLAMGYYNPLRLIGIAPDAVSPRSQLMYNTTKRMFVCSL